MQSPTYFSPFRASDVGCIHLNNVGLFTQGISLVTRTTSGSSRDHFVREFADLLPLTVGLLDGLVALSGTEALPEAIGQPQTHAATMVIRHPASLRDITEEVAGIRAHRPPGIEEGEAVVGGGDTICRGLLSRSTQANTKEEGNDKEARSLWDALLQKALDSGRCLPCVRPPYEGRVCTANLEKGWNKQIPFCTSYFTQSGCQPIVVGGVNLYRSVSEPIVVGALTYIGRSTDLYRMAQQAI